MAGNEISKNTALIYYLGHSGYAVKTASHFLIFDYFEGSGPIKNRSLLNGLINPEEIKSENVFVFVSHKHEDHYDRIINSWKALIPNITYISGWRSKGTNFIGVPPHSEVKVENITINTLRSTDEGSGFLVKVDDLYIFHAGDHANWDDNAPDISYFDEIDYISGIKNNIDIAFIPVTTFSGIRRKSMTEGAIYALSKLQPKITFPMHGNGREFLYKEFSREAGAKAYNIFCPEVKGDSFKYIKK